MRRPILTLTTLAALTAGAQIIRWDLAILKPAQHGSLTVYKFFACEDWRKAGGANPLDTPERGPDWPLLCDMDGTAKGLVILYWREVNGVARFTNASGGLWRQPRRWAYVRLAEDVWNGASHRPPGVEASDPVTMDLDATMRYLQASGHTKKDMMDAMDRLVWADGKGAPE